MIFIPVNLIKYKLDSLSNRSEWWDEDNNPEKHICDNWNIDQIKWNWRSNNKFINQSI